MKALACVIALVLSAAAAEGATASKQAAWGTWTPPPAAPPPHRHHHRHASRQPSAPAPTKAAERRITTLQAELAQMRRELDDVRTQVSAATLPRWTGLQLPGMAGVAFMPSPGAPQTRLASFPDLRQPEQPPANPAPALPALSGIEAVDHARAYLVATATPGFTMSRQGPAVAIGRLHPEFVIRLERAIREARAAGLDHAGVFSAYRPPAFGVGGFSDKFNSLHSYGLAVDMTGIGSAGSAAARLWQRAVKAAELFLPYGPNNRAEFNHTQLIGGKVALARMRATITASAPKDLRSMWLASGVSDRVPPAQPINSARLLPDVDWSVPAQ